MYTAEQMLAMSDEELAQVDLSLLDQTTATEQSSEEQVVEETSVEESQQEEQSAEEGEQQSSEESQEESEEEQSAAEEVAQGEENAEASTQAEGTQSSESTDFTSIFTKPFKANGKEIQVKTPEEAIKLMSMGANYTQKMQELAPVRKIHAMLAKANMLDPEAIAQMIDAYQGKPEAITSLVQKHKIDPLDMDVDTPSAYRPEVSVTDASLALDDVLKELTASDTGKTVLESVRSWDDVSAEKLANHPQALLQLEQHVADGTYQKIMGEVDRAFALGQVGANIPVLQVYEYFLNELKNSPELPVRQPIATAPRVKPVTNPVKPAAAPPRNIDKSVKNDVLDLLNLGDEEFKKHFK